MSVAVYSAFVQRQRRAAHNKDQLDKEADEAHDDEA